jgi:hypothetical protein
MAKAKGAAIEFAEFPSILITWGPHGRYTIKRKGTSQPVGFLAPIRWKWQLQSNPSLKPIGDPIEQREEALRNAAEHFNR